MFVHALSLILMFSAQAAEKPSHVSLTTHNLSPYGYYENGSKKPLIADKSFKGMAVDVLKCAFSSMDVNLTIHVLPWSRAQNSVKSQQYDGFFAASKQSSRDSFATMTIPIAEQKWTWYLLAETKLTPTQQGFKSQSMVASFNGANMQSWLQNNNYQVAANPQTTKELYKMLKIKRLDAILANNLVMDEIIQLDPKKVPLQSFVLRNKPLGVYFHNAFLKKYPGLMAELNSAITHCRGH